MRQMLCFRISLVVCVLVWAVTGHAALELELTRGVRAPLPVTIVPFEQASVQASGHPFSGVIQHDLAMSGECRVVKAATESQALAQSGVEKVNYLVTGSVSSDEGGRVVHVQLRTVYRSGSDQRQNQQVVWQDQFRVMPQKERALAHHISDIIYQQLTGTRGIFSTKLAYILVKRRVGKPTQYILEVSDADGLNPQPLLKSYEPIMSPAWFPDARRLAYVSFEQHRASIYIQDLATGNRTLFSQEHGINGAPAVSPDGRQIAFVLTKTGTPKIYLMDLRRRHLKQLTTGWSMDTEPSWSYDQKSLLFTSSRGGQPQVYRYDFSAGQAKRLTYKGNYNARASFTPNDQDIIMMHRSNNLFGIARMAIGTGRWQVLALNGRDESPSIAPNGKMIVYATRQGRRGVLSMVSIDGQIQLKLPARDGDVQEPAWSPFLQSDTHI